MPITIKVPIGDEWFDEAKQEFFTPTTPVVLEHSLVSLSKWEAFFEKPFLSEVEKTDEETRWYVRAMVLGEVPEEVLLKLSQDNINEVNEYIASKQTATTFRELPGQKNNREIVTAEIIMYWMISMNIPFEFKHVHLNQLFALIRVVNQKNAPQKKMTRAEIAQRNRDLNAQRKARLGTKG